MERFFANAQNDSLSRETDLRMTAGSRGEPRKKSPKEEQTKRNQTKKNHPSVSREN